MVVTIALLGFALLTLLLGARAGARIAESGHRRLGGLSGLASFAVLSAAVTLSVLHPMARPSIWQGVLLPTLVFGAGLGLGMLRADRDTDRGAARRGWRRGGFARWVAGLPIDTRATAGAALRAGGAAVALILAISAVALTTLLVFGYADIIRLYEALHTEVVGGIAVTALQLALLPDLVVWTASWFVGSGLRDRNRVPGLSARAPPSGRCRRSRSSARCPPESRPSPSPDCWSRSSAGFLAGAAVRPALARALDGVRLPAVVLVGLGGGAAGAVLLGLLAWASRAAPDPGRLADVGPSPLAVGVVALIELAPAIALGVASGAVFPRGRRPDRAR